jgi:hypothetical protein
MEKMDKELRDELQKKAQPVEYIVHEGEMARFERVNRRMLVIILVLISLLAASWIGFFVYESQFEDIRIEAEQTNDSAPNYAVAGDVYGVEAKGNN